MNKSSQIDRMIEELTTLICMKLDDDNITSVDKVELFFDEDLLREQKVGFYCICNFTSEHPYNRMASSVDCHGYEKPDFNIKKLEKQITKSIKEYLKGKEGKNGTTD